jgi:hypothetical protein
MGAKDYAIVVGITKYPDLTPLDGPVEDAEDFVKWLRDPRGGNVPDANIKKIVTSPNPPPGKPRPKREDVDDELDAIYKLGVQNDKVGDRLYFYFAGHGFATSIQDAALLMANASSGTPGYNISGRPYADYFRTAAFFKEVVLFMDCCRENYFAKPTEPPYEKIVGDKAGLRYYGFATQWSRSTREGPWGPKGEKRGIFTLTLLDALRTKVPRDAKGQVSGAELAGYVITAIKTDDRVQKLRALGEDPYRPEFDFDHDPDFDLKFNAPIGEAACNPEAEDAGAVLEAFAPPPPPRYTIRIALQNGDAARQFDLLFNAQPPAIPPAAQTATEWTWQVDTPGLYKLQRDDGKSSIVEVAGEKETFDVQLP